MPPSQRLDIGCSLSHGAFEYDKTLTISPPAQSLVFFILHLIARLRACGTAPAADFTAYLKRVQL